MNLSKLFGIHAVEAALDFSPEKIMTVWVDNQRQDQRLNAIIKKLSVLELKLNYVERKKLDKFSEGKNHQGIVAEVELPHVRSEEELKHHVSHLNSTPFFLILDHVQDPHNLGACLRTADAAKVDGIIITKDNAIGITPTVCKVASGAAETVPVYQVTNLARILRWLKEQNIWIIGAAGEAKETIFTADLNIPLALVMGAEGKGMRQLTQQHCDLLVKIPMQGHVESLNVSVAAAVMIYEIVRQRG